MREPFDDLDFQPIGVAVGARALGHSPRLRLARDECEARGAPGRLTAARGALASGVAIGGAPFVLAHLADLVGLRTAYLIVPVILAALAARTLTARA